MFLKVGLASRLPRASGNAASNGDGDAIMLPLPLSVLAKPRRRKKKKTSLSFHPVLSSPASRITKCGKTEKDALRYGKQE